MFAFGYFNTDEGGYTSGGRSFYLHRSFFDAETNDPPDIHVSWGMNVIGWIGYLFLGLSYGAVRLPVMLLAISTWFMLFLFLSRKTKPLFAFLAVLLVSCNPVSLTYERTASSDIAVSALMMSVLFILISTQSSRWWILAGLIVGFAWAVKRTMVGFIPLAGFLVFHRSGTRKPMVLLGLTAAASVALFYFLTEFSIAHEITFRGLNGSRFVWHTQLIREHLFDFRAWLTALWLFPRLPVSLQFGPLLFLIFLLSMVGILQGNPKQSGWFNQRRRWAAGSLVYLFLLAFQIRTPARYYLPLLFLLPVLSVFFRRSLFHLQIEARRSHVAVAIVVMLILYWFTVPMPPEASLHRREISFIIYEYSFISPIPWLTSFMVRAAGFGLLAIVFRNLIFPRQGFIKSALVIFFLAGCNNFFFANYESLLTTMSVFNLADQLINQLFVGFMLLIVCKRPGRKIPQSPIYQWGSVIVIFAIVSLGNERWSSSYRSLFQRSYEVKKVADHLKEEWPRGSIVLGRRASTLLRHTDFKLGPTYCTLPPDLFLEQVERLLLRYPDRRLYWLVDEDVDSYRWKEYMDFSNERLSFEKEETLSLPGDMTFEFIEVPVYRIRLKK